MVVPYSRAAAQPHNKPAFSPCAESLAFLCLLYVIELFQIKQWVFRRWIFKGGPGAFPSCGIFVPWHIFVWLVSVAPRHWQEIHTTLYFQRVLTWTAVLTLKKCLSWSQVHRTPGVLEFLCKCRLEVISASLSGLNFYEERSCGFFHGKP